MLTKIILKQILVTAGALCGLATLGVAGSFTNGSFESPGGTTPVTLSLGSTYITGWTHGGTGDELYSKSGDFGILAGDGTYYVTWCGGGQTGGTVFPAFDALVGAT